MTSPRSAKDRFDVVVVGARCAGSPLATLLARRGFNVCVLDRAQFPSETPSTHLIQPCGVQMLDRLGVLNAVLGAGAVPLDQITFINDDVRFDLTNDGTLEWPALIVRRVTLDALLVDAAREAGADIRTGCRVTRLLMDGDRAVGVETDAGLINAQLVVGADGRHSTVASLVGAAEYHVTPPGRFTAWAYFDGVANREGRMWLGRVGELAYLAGPTDSDLFMAAITSGFANQAEFHADRDANFTAAIRAWPELADATWRWAPCRCDPHADQMARLFSASRRPWMGFGGRRRALQRSDARAKASRTRFAKPNNSRRQSRTGVTTPLSTLPSNVGGVGATTMPTRCTGSPAT